MRGGWRARWRTRWRARGRVRKGCQRLCIILRRQSTSSTRRSAMCCHCSVNNRSRSECFVVASFGALVGIGSPPGSPSRACADTTTTKEPRHHPLLTPLARHHQMLRNTLRATMSSKLRAAIIVVSETANKDASTDKCIPALQEVFQQDGGDRWESAQTRIVADDVVAIREAVKAYTDGADNANLVVTSGGTGFAQKDVTPEVSSWSMHCCCDNTYHGST